LRIREGKLGRDSDDDNILSCALNGNADLIITGDKDLLILKEFNGIPIFSPGDFWRYERKKERP